MATSTGDTTPTSAPNEFGLARLLKDIRTAGAEPTHRFPDIERLYDELFPEDAPAPAPADAVVLQFPGTRRN